MAESEESYNSAGEDDSENEVENAGAAGAEGAGGRREAKMKEIPPPFDLAKAREELGKLSEDIRRKPDAKSKLKLSWVQIIPAFEAEAGRNGLSDEDIELIWKIISCPNVKCAGKFRSSLMLVLVPKMQLSGDFLKQIRMFVTQAVKNEKLRGYTVFYKAILAYFYGVTVYSLVQGDVMRSSSMYMSLFHLSKYSSLLIPVCQLLKKMTTKINFTPFHVSTAMDLKNTHTKPAERRAVIDLLRKYQVLRPEFFNRETLKFRVGARTTVKSMLPDNFKFRLYQAKRRVVNPNGGPVEMPEDLDATLVVSGNFYPELAVDVENHTLESILARNVPKKDAMFWAVKNDFYVMFQMHPELLEVLEDWVDIHLEHKLPNVLNEDIRVDYFLKQLVNISRTLHNGLTIVDDWLLDYMSTWDFNLFKDHILALFSHLNVFDPTEILPGYVLRTMGFHMLNSKDSLAIWDATEKLLLRWARNICLDNGHEAGKRLEVPEDDPAVQAVNALFVIMKQWLAKYIAFYVSDPHKNDLISRMMLTFTDLSKEFNEGGLTFEPVPPVGLIHAIILVDDGLGFEILSEFMLNTTDWPQKLKQDGPGVQTYKKLKQEVERFFEVDESQPPMTDLFAEELRLLHANAEEMPAQLALVESALNNLTIESSKAFGLFRKAQAGGRKGPLDMNEMKQVIPHAAKYYSKLQKKSFVPQFASTPLQVRGANQ